MNRRQFLEKSTLSLAAAGLLSQLPGSLYASTGGKLVKVPIGFQSYVLKEEIGKDIVGICKKMESYGYQQVEMCSPSGSHYKVVGFGPLAKYSGKELKQMIEDSGLSCISCHFQLEELTDKLDESIDFAHQLGLKYMVCSGGLGSPDYDELKKNCEQMNIVGEKTKQAGLISAYHNHNGEFETKINGRPVYDLLLEELDPDLVKMQFQVAVITLGYKAATYFRKYPGRFVSAHLQDYSPSDSTKEVVLGQGIVDWEEFFKASKEGGVKVAFVEMESDPATLKNSVTYLKNL
jgi:sugar phosphate isomerase/epimerase